MVAAMAETAAVMVEIVAATVEMVETITAVSPPMSVLMGISPIKT